VKIFRRLSGVLLLMLFSSAMAASVYEQALPALSPTAKAAPSSTVPSSASATASNTATSATAAPADMPTSDSLFQANTASAPKMVATNPNSELAVLMSKVMQINTQLMQYQQNVNTQVTTLQTSNQQTEQQVAELAAVMKTFSAELQSIKAQALQIQSLQQKAAGRTNIQKAESAFGTWPFLLMAGVIIVLLIFVAVGFWPNKSAKQKKGPSSDDNDEKADYDFMTTKEAMPAKLDLARAYVAMDDVVSARVVLEEIQQRGNKEQIREAVALLEKIQSVSTPDADT
jgi:FimV-like protein